VVVSRNLFQSRLLLPAFVALYPVLAWLYEALGRFDRPQFSLRRLTGMVIAVSLAASLLVQLMSWLPYQPWAYLTGSESRPEYLERALGNHYRALGAINRLPAEATVTFLFEPRSYFCQRRCLPDSILDKLGHLEYRLGTAEAIAESWRAEGVTHVLLWRGGLEAQMEALARGGEPLAPPEALDELTEQYLEPVETIGSYELYRLVTPPGP
jgi:hypothetical protein